MDESSWLSELSVSRDPLYPHSNDEEQEEGKEQEERRRGEDEEKQEMNESMKNQKGNI